MKVFLLSILVFSSYIFAGRDNQYSELLNELAKTKKIIYTYQVENYGNYQPAKSLIFTNEKFINEAIKLIKFSEKESCRCRHTKKIYFINGTNELVASVSNHSFDLKYKSVNYEFKMPIDFWNKLQAFAPTEEKE